MGQEGFGYVWGGAVALFGVGGVLVLAEEFVAFDVEDGAEDILGCGGVHALLDEGVVAEEVSECAHEVEVEVDGLGAAEEEHMDGLAVGGAEVNALLGEAVDDAAGELEG